MRHVQAKAVIGAGYGDEGKGRMTDLLAADAAASVVVRSNGGAQAGHTVVTPDGRRHVFHHIGSGAFAGTPTHLSASFVAHPMMLMEEWRALNACGINAQISSDPRVIVTTPFDMIINQSLEIVRGNSRHGSCGLGFGETIERNLHPEFALRTVDLHRLDLSDRLQRIWTEWVPQRLQHLGISEMPSQIMRDFNLEAILAHFLSDCQAYLDRLALWPDKRIAEKGAIIFEGAQGLMLDQDYGAFPHVTRSNTGLKNMIAVATEAGVRHIDVVYVTRCYATRHGAGPLAHEVTRLKDVDVDDPTNAPNDWQGALRLAPLDVAALRAAIAHDLECATADAPTIDASLAVTCLDQADRIFTIQDGDKLQPVNSANAAEIIAHASNLPLFGEGWGPRRNDFRRVAPAK